MRDMIAFVLILLLAGFADGLMEMGIPVFLAVGVLTLGAAGALVCASGRKR